MDERVKENADTIKALAENALEEIGILVKIFNEGFSNPNCHYSSKDIQVYLNNIQSKNLTLAQYEAIANEYAIYPNDKAGEES